MDSPGFVMTLMNFRWFLYSAENVICAPWKLRFDDSLTAPNPFRRDFFDVLVFSPLMHELFQD